MTIPRIHVKEVDIPNIYTPDWMSRQPNVEHLVPPVVLNIGNPIVDMPGCVKMHRDNQYHNNGLPIDRNLVENDPDRAMILCYAEIVKTQNLAFLNLCRVIVRPDLRGKGLGKTFCKSLIDQVILTNRYRSIQLNVLECNQPAISCYQSLGFKISQRFPYARQIKNEAYDVVVMTKSLEIK